MYKLYKNYGSNNFSWKELIQPAINIAKLNLKLSYSEKYATQQPNTMLININNKSILIIFLLEMKN